MSALDLSGLPALATETIVLERGPHFWRCRGRDYAGNVATYRLDSGRWRQLHPAEDDQIALAAALESTGCLAECFDFDHIDQCRVLSYRPGRRLVLRVRGVRAGRLHTLYIKGVRSRRFAQWRTTHARLADCSLAPHLLLPESSAAELSAMAFPAAAGTALSDPALATLNPDALEQLLEAFQMASSDTHTPLPTRGFEEERTSCLTMLRRAQGLHPSVDALQDFVESLDAPVDSGPVGIVHGDLHDKQIFVMDRSLRSLVIDLDTVSTGPVLLDRVNLEEHLRLRCAQLHYRRRSVHEALVKWLNSSDTILAGPWRILTRARLAAVHAARPTNHEWAVSLAEDLVRVRRLGA